MRFAITACIMTGVTVRKTGIISILITAYPKEIAKIVLITAMIGRVMNCEVD